MLFTRLRSSMKTVVIIVSLAFVGTLFYVGLSPKNKGTNTATEAIAKVNGENLPRTEFDSNFYSYTQYQEQNTGQPVTGDSLLQIKVGLFDQMVDRKLVLQAADEEGTKLDKKALEKEFDRIKNQFPTKDAFTQALTQANLTEKELKNNIKESKLLDTFQADKKKSMKVTSGDLAKAYEQVKASHILIGVADKATKATWDAAKTKADGILAEIKAGGDFATLAKKYSEDPGSKANGGDLGFFPRKQMVAEFDKAAFALKVGEVSTVVKSKFGYHIIKVTGRKDAKGKEFQKAKKELTTKLRDEKYQKWFAGYKKKAEIEVLDHEIQGYKLATDKKFDEALAEYSKASEADPSNAYIYVNQGKIFMEKKDNKSAIQMFEKAVETNESDSAIRMVLGNAYKENKQVDKAMVEFKKAAELSPMDFYLHFSLLNTYQQLGKKDDAKVEEAQLQKIYKAMEEQRKAQAEQQKQLDDAQKAADGAKKQSDAGKSGSAADTTKK